MPLQLWKRHTKSCREKNSVAEYDQSLKRCKCPIHAWGTLRNDGFVRASTRESVWERAEDIKRTWEEAGTRSAEAPVEVQPEPDLHNGKTPFETAIAEFKVGYIEARKLNSSTAYKYGIMLKQLQAFARALGFRYVNEFNLATLQQFQNSWRMGARAAAKKLEQVRCFFRFCVDREFIPNNPAEKMHAPTPRVTAKEPFSQAELERIYVGCRQYPTTKADREAPKVYAFVLLMRYTGFRISDAAFFSIDKLEGTHAFLYMTKTGDPVYVPLPDFVVRALKALPLVREKYFFMTGRGSERLESITDVWRKKLKRVFQVAGPFTSTPHPHRFRHTFACDLLQKGVPVDDVAILLGHSDPRITLRHYARWIKGRQDRLDNLVKEAWKADAAHFQIVPRSKKSA
jgi:integrase